MKCSQTVQLVLVASVASLLTSCNQRATRYCVDENQNVRDERNCDSGDSGFHWYYARGYGSVAIGGRVTGGSVTPPADGFVSRSASGAVEGESGSARGGIGEAGEAASGHGGAGSAGE